MPNVILTHYNLHCQFRQWTARPLDCRPILERDRRLDSEAAKAGWNIIRAPLQDLYVRDGRGCVLLPLRLRVRQVLQVLVQRPSDELMRPQLVQQVLVTLRSRRCAPAPTTATSARSSGRTIVAIPRFNSYKHPFPFHIQNKLIEISH